MLELRIDNTPMDLDPDARVEVVASCPVLDRDSVERVFSFPFRVPLSAHNRRVRQHSNRLDAANRLASVPGEIRLESHTLLSARVLQTGLTDKDEEIVCANEPLDLWRKLGTIKINEILEKLDLLDGVTLPAWTFGFPGPGSYSITVDGTTATASAATFGDIPTAGASLASQLNVAFPGMAVYSSGANTLTLDGFLVKEHPITAFLGITLNAWKNIALYHYNAVRDHVEDVNATPVDSHCFPVIRWRGIYGANNQTFENTNKYVNNAQDGVFYANVKYQGDEYVWQNTVIPCPRVPYVLTKIGEALGGYVWSGDVWDDAQFQRLIVVNNRTLDTVQEDQWDDLDFWKLNCFQPEINLNLHVPAMTAADFISALCVTFGLYLSAAEGSLTLVKKRNAVVSPPRNLDGMVSPRFSSEPNRTDGWKLYTARDDKELATNGAQLLAVQSGGGEAAVATVNTLFWQDDELMQLATYVKTPITNQPGASPAFQSGENRTTMPLCLLFCYELQESSDGSEYIFASHDNLDYDGNVVGTFTLSPAGDAGLYQVWHKGVIENAVADSLKVTAYLHIGLIQQLLNWENVRVTFYHPEGGYLVGTLKEVRVTGSNKGVGSSFRIIIRYPTFVGMTDVITIQTRQGARDIVVPGSWDDLSTRDFLIYYAMLFENTGSDLTRVAFTGLKLIEMTRGILGVDMEFMKAWEADCVAEDAELGKWVFLDELKHGMRVALGGLFDYVEDEDGGGAWAVKFNRTKNAWPVLTQSPLVPQVGGRVASGRGKGRGKGGGALKKAGRPVWLYGPDDGLSNITIYELAYTFGTYENFVRTGDEQYAHLLIGALYRPSRPETREERESGWFGDRRQALRRREKKVEERARLAATLPVLAKRAILFWFASCRERIVAQYPKVFKPAESAKIGDNNYGWGGVLLSVAGGPAGLEVVSDQHYSNTLTFLSMKEDEAREMERMMEEAKRGRKGR